MSESEVCTCNGWVEMPCPQCNHPDALPLEYCGRCNDEAWVPWDGSDDVPTVYVHWHSQGEVYESVSS